MHEHNECEHNLKYCSKCNVVYCTKCKREWGGHQHNYWPYYYPNTITYDVPDWKWEATCGTANNNYEVTACNHN